MDDWVSSNYASENELDKEIRVTCLCIWHTYGIAIDDFA